MSAQRISRRKFLALGGGVLGAGALGCCGLTALSTGLFDETVPIPEMPDAAYGEPQMNDKTLIAYASQGGATAGIADAIGQALSASGTAVDVRPVSAVADLSPYRAVVLGSAIHGGVWLPEMLAFVEQHREALKRVPTALFQVCMMLAARSDQYRRMVSPWLDPVVTQVTPVAAESFAGMLWPNQYAKLSERLGLRIFLLAIGLKPGDYRDWAAVRAWAESLRPLLNLGQNG